MDVERVWCKFDSRCKEPKMKCFNKKCDNDTADAIDTGLCLSCQSKAKKLVASGKTTWEGLAAVGMCKSKDTRDEFEKEYDRLVAERQDT